MRLFLQIACLSSLASLLRADPLDFWTLTHSLTNHGPSGLAWGNGRFVASVYRPNTSSNALLTSDDGTNWRTTFEDGGRIIFGNGLFISTASEGRIISSPDGENWVTRRLPIEVFNSNLVVPALGKFWTLAGFLPTTLLCSSNALQWAPALTNAPARGILFGDEATLILGGDPPVVTYDGTNFSLLHSFPQMESLARLGQTWVGVTGRTLTVSTNGLDWVSFSPSHFFQGGSVRAMGGRFVLVSYDKNFFFVSEDGLKWVDHEVALRVKLVGLERGRDSFLALSYQELDTPKPGVYVRVCRIHRSRALTPTLPQALDISLGPILSIPSGIVGAGYAVESAEQPTGPWMSATTVFPATFPFQLIAPTNQAGARFFRTVGRDR